MHGVTMKTIWNIQRLGTVLPEDLFCLIVREIPCSNAITIMSVLQNAVATTRTIYFDINNLYILLQQYI